MKNFVALFDPERFSQANLDYSVYLAGMANAHLTGVFLEDILERGYVYPDMESITTGRKETTTQVLDSRAETDFRKYSNTFKNACLRAEVDCSIHRDRNLPIKEITHESAFADLLIVGATENMRNETEPAPTRFIQKMVEQAHCPVVVTPHEYKTPEQIVLLYDGTAASIYAFRTFSYLFDRLTGLPVRIVNATDGPANPRLPDKYMINEFLKHHFPKAETILLSGTPEQVIGGYLLRHKEHTLVVLGMHHRSWLSRIFFSSVSDDLLEKVNLPVFISSGY